MKDEKGLLLRDAEPAEPGPHPFRAKKALELLNSLEGLEAIHVMHPHGTLLVFWDRTKAVMARNRIEETGNRCGRFIMDCRVEDDMQTLTVLGPTEWTGRE